ncbi:MAG: MerR family transcriptional regulator [Ruminococcaceae bacterium]|nr:MerR family transcriptional regulator [Oscillospiraceae bacterium]
MKYHIGDVARILGITSGALHFFEKEGIINTKKENNGYRYYDEEDVFRLLSYFKYRSMGVPLKDIGKQFSGKERDRNKVIERVRRSREICTQKIAYYEHLRQLIDDYLCIYDKIPDLLGNYEFAQSSELIFISFGEHGWIAPRREQQDQIHKWVKAMPATHLSVLCTGWENESDELSAVLGYSIKPWKAEKYDLKYDNEKIVTLQSLPCYHTIVSADPDFVYAPGKVFSETMKNIRKRNLTLSAPPFGNILLVDVDGSITHPLVELWFPIR